MKLIIAIIGKDEAEPVVDALNREAIRATLIDVHGGWLGEGHAALLIGLEDRVVHRALTLVERYCQRRTTMLPAEIGVGLQDWPLPEVESIETGGATVFVLPVVRHERF